MDILSPALRLCLVILIIIFLGFGLTSDVFTASAGDFQQIERPLVELVEQISFDSSGKIMQLNSPDNMKNLDLSDNQFIGVFDGVAADSSYAYIVDHVYYPGGRNVGLNIVDFFAPGGPELVGFLGIDLANDIYIKGNYAYVVSGFTQWSNLLSIVNISNPSNPTLASAISLSGPGMDVFVEGEYAYIALDSFGSGRFQIINVSTPASPFVVSTYYDGVGSYGIFEHEGIAYLADEYALMVLDVTNPYSPYLISEVWSGVNDATSVVLKNNIAYMTTDATGGHGALYIVDMTMTEFPNLMAIYEIPEASARDILVLGNFGFVANDIAGLRIMDLSDGYNPSTISIIDTSDTALDLAVADRNLYLADGDSVYLFHLNLYSASGRVFDTAGHPLNNFPVSAGNDSKTLTDSDGYYVLDGLPEGSYSITAYKNGYHAVSPAINIQVPPSVAAPDIVVDPNTVRGKVMAANTMPISGVEIYSSDGRYVHTGGSGNYQLSQLIEESYIITPTLTDWIFQPPNLSFAVPPYHHTRNFWLLPAPMTIQLIPGVPAQISYQEFQGTSTTIQFPQNAVTETATLVISPLVINPAWGYKFTGHAFEISSQDKNGLLPEITLTEPITVTIEYSDIDLKAIIEESLINMQVWDGVSWQEAANTCDPPSTYFHDYDLNLISFTLCRTGIYALLGPTYNVGLPIIFHAP